MRKTHVFFDFEITAKNPKSKIQNPKSKIQNPKVYLDEQKLINLTVVYELKMDQEPNPIDEFIDMLDLQSTQIADSPYERPSVRFGQNFPDGITPDSKNDQTSLQFYNSCDNEDKMDLVRAIVESKRELEQKRIQENYANLKENLAYKDYGDDIISYYGSTTDDENDDDCHFDLSQQSVDYSSSDDEFNNGL